MHFDTTDSGAFRQNDLADQPRWATLTIVRLNRLTQLILAFNVATIGLWGWTALEFLTRRAITVPGTAADLYLLLLAIYAGDKELERWRHRHQSISQRGEYFVIGWVGLTLLTLIVELDGGRKVGYVVPHELPLIVGGVLVIYFATQYLKVEYRNRSSITGRWTR